VLVDKKGLKEKEMAKAATKVANEAKAAELSNALNNAMDKKLTGKVASTRSTWKGWLSFSLVNMPVKVLTGQKTDRVSLNMLHDTCKTRLQQRMYCPDCDTYVTNDHIVKGFEHEDGKYVTISKEEIEECLLESTTTLTIEKFIPASKIDPVMIESTDYIVPDKGGDQAYGLLLQGMITCGKVGISRLAQRGSESVIVIRPLTDGSGMALSYLYYDPEVRSCNFPAKPAQKPEEIALVGQIIDALSGEFDPAEYKDQKLEAVRALVATKVAGQKPTKKVSKKAPAAASTDLMGQLAAALAAAKSKK
jgi:DNA end-binding protein Ku